MNDKTSIGGISIEVKAGLNVGDETARICMDLLAIYFKNGGCKGVVLKFNDSDVGVQALLSDNAVDVAMAASWTVKRKSITPVAPDYSSQVTKIKEDSE